MAWRWSTRVRSWVASPYGQTNTRTDRRTVLRPPIGGALNNGENDNTQTELLDIIDVSPLRNEVDVWRQTSRVVTISSLFFSVPATSCIRSERFLVITMPASSVHDPIYKNIGNYGWRVSLKRRLYKCLYGYWRSSSDFWWKDKFWCNFCFWRRWRHSFRRRRRLDSISTTSRCFCQRRLTLLQSRPADHHSVADRSTPLSGRLSWSPYKSRSSNLLSVLNETYGDPV